MANEMNIFQRMAAATAEITHVAKNLEIGYGNSKYNAVSEADVLAAVRKAEQKYGIYSYPYKREIISSGQMESTDRNGNVTKKLLLRVLTTYRFVNIDKPEEFIETQGYGDGVDPQDKAPGKAMTYSDKYCLLKAYKIVTGDDPDQEASQPLQGVKTKQYQQQPAQQYQYQQQYQQQYPQYQYQQ